MSKEKIQQSHHSTTTIQIKSDASLPMTLDKTHFHLMDGWMDGTVIDLFTM